MARRAGQITNRGERRWLVRWHLGQDLQTGKYRYKSRTIRGTKRDAQNYLNGVLRSRDLGTYVEPTRVTLDAYLDRWLRTSAQKLAARTLDDYRRLLVRYVRPKLGHRRLDSLRPLDLQKVYDTMLEHGLGPRTVGMAHAPLRQALEQAVRWGLLATNPARLVQLPKQRAPERRSLSLAEVKKFREAASETPLAALWELMLLTGLRPAEALGLRWQDLDLNRPQLTVRQALQRTAPGCWKLREPKTPKSRRTVPISARLADLLRSHKAAQAGCRLRRRPGTRPYLTELDLVFTTGHGGILDPDNLGRRQFRKLVKAAQLPADVTPYSLRHTCASVALEAGIPVLVVAERLGHASAKMTLDVYGHVLPGQQAAATERLESALG